MSESLKVAIISGSFSLSVAVFSSFLAYWVAKLNGRNNKTKSVAQEQYHEVFAPLHKILFFDKDNVEKEYSNSLNIIEANYGIIPQKILDDFKVCRKNEIITCNFRDNVNACYLYYNDYLGYSKIRLTNKEKKEAKEIININQKWIKHLSHIQIFSFFYFLMMMLMLLIVTLAEKVAPNVYMTDNAYKIFLKIDLLLSLCFVETFLVSTAFKMFMSLGVDKKGTTKKVK